MAKTSRGEILEIGGEIGRKVWRRVSIVNHVGPGRIAREDERREKGSGIGCADNERYSRAQKG